MISNEMNAPQAYHSTSIDVDLYIYALTVLHSAYFIAVAIGG